jgi:hypothetical protein
MNEPTVLEEQVHDAAQALDHEDIEDLLVDSENFVDMMIARGLPQYLKPEAFGLLERLRQALGWVTLH